MLKLIDWFRKLLKSIVIIGVIVTCLIIAIIIGLSADKTLSNQNCIGDKICDAELVTKIVDGDTLYTKSYKIRLSLTNTPKITVSTCLTTWLPQTLHLELTIYQASKSLLRKFSWVFFIISFRSVTSALDRFSKLSILLLIRVFVSSAKEELDFCLLSIIAASSVVDISITCEFSC